MTIDVREADAATLVRLLRTHRALDQRELAALAGVPRSTVDRIEARRVDPRFGTVHTLIRATGHHLELHDQRCAPVVPDLQREELRDAVGRQFPAHLRYGRTPGPYEETPEGYSWWRWYHDWPGSGDWIPEWTYWRPKRWPKMLRPITGREYDLPYDDAT